LLEKSRHRPRIFYFDRVSPGAIRLAKHARDSGALIVFEPASVGDEKKFQTAVDCCDVLKYSQERLGNMPDLAVAQTPKLIVETRGEAGLRFRWRNRWAHLNAIMLDEPIDAAGSGDWCTAGLIHWIGRQGVAGFSRLRKAEIVTALRTGQALASINCQFYGARGAMMILSLRQINRQLQQISLRANDPFVEEIGTAHGTKPPEFCRHCEPLEAVSGRHGTKRPSVAS
jgi:fructokinase